MPSVSNPLPRGQRHDNDTLPHCLGMEKVFPDTDGSASRPPRPVLSGMSVTCRYVENGEGAALAPGRLVKHQDDKTVNDLIKYVEYTEAATDTVVGVVDDHLPTAGAASGENFWVVTEGPTRVYGGATGAAQAWIIPHATDGSANTFATGGTVNTLDDVANVVGYQLVAMAASTLTRAVVCKAFRV